MKLPADAVWLITGCSTGIGREIADLVLAEGYRVVVTARRTEAVADLVAGHDNRAIAVALDVTDREQIAAAVAAADKAFGGIDVLVNNAGYGYMAALEEGEDDEVRRLFDTNYFGVVDTIKAALPPATDGSGASGASDQANSGSTLDMYSSCSSCTEGALSPW